MEISLYDCEPNFAEMYELVPDDYNLFIEDGILKAYLNGEDKPIVIQGLPDNYKYLFNGIKVVAKAKLTEDKLLLIL